MSTRDPAQRILVVEDDPDIAQLLRIHFKDLGYSIDHCLDGAAGLAKALGGDYSLIILDLMLPKLDGYEVCKRLRARNLRVPVMILSLKSDLTDKILGLELGADDYMTKPFSVQELVARARALIRRAQPAAEADAEPAEVRIGRLVIAPVRRRVTVEDKEIELTRKQFDLLLFMAGNPGRPFEREELLARIWGYDSSGYEHTVDTHINRLRAKIEPDPSHPRYIITVWGVGYRFVEARELE